MDHLETYARESSRTYATSTKRLLHSQKQAHIDTISCYSHLIMTASRSPQTSSPNNTELDALRLRVEGLERALLALAGVSSIEKLLGQHAIPDAPINLAQPTESLPDVSVSPTPAARTRVPGEVTKDSPTTDKMALYMSRFRGREDIHAFAWTSKDGQKKAWFPATRHAKFKDDPSPENLRPLDASVITKHLTRTEFFAGLYPLLPDDTCYLLACDFDDGDFQQDALAYAEQCRAHGLDPLIELSRSGTGAHVWIFFETAVPAQLTRQVGLGLLASSPRPVKFSSYDRFFPAQDRLPVNARGQAQLGNLIALPLQGNHRQNGTTVFVDDDFHPFDDQFAVLSRTRLATQQQLQKIRDGLYSDNDPEQLPSPPRKHQLKQVAKTNKAKSSADTKVSVTHDSLVHIATANLDTTTLNALRHLGVFPNPEFYKLQNQRFSTWGKPRVIVRYQEDASPHGKHELRLDRGLLEPAIDILKEAGYTVTRRGHTPKPQKIDATFTGELTPPQKKALNDITAHHTGVLVAPPGTGKTVIACALIAQRRVPTAVIVRTRELAAQWHDRLTRFLDATPGTKAKPTHVVDIISATAIGRKDTDASFLEQYGQVIVDECHGVAAPGLTAALSELNIRYWTGLTATPYRSDGLDPLITMLLGPIRHTIAPQHTTRREYHPHLTKFTHEILGRVDMTEIYNALAADADRNTQILTVTAATAQAGHNVLVLSNRRAHVAALTEELRNQLPNTDVFSLTGGLTPAERHDLHAQLDASEHFVLVAMDKVAGEGFDLPTLDALVLASPISFKGNIIQRIGRVTRGATNTAATVHDFNDYNCPPLAKMFKRRQRVIKNEGFDITPVTGTPDTALPLSLADASSPQHRSKQP